MNYIEELKPIKVYIGNEDFGIYKYVPERNRYEGFIGCLDLNMVIQIINKNPEVSHLRIEMVD